MQKSEEKFQEKSGQNAEAKHDQACAERWPALLRGSILSGVIAKNVNYVGFADRRAQAIITINAILVPLILAAITQGRFQMEAVIALVTAILSIAAAVFSLYPKHYHPTGDVVEKLDLLHFSQIENVSKEQYLAVMNRKITNTPELAELVALDIWHMSVMVLKPKFFWLKVSYFVFLLGNVAAMLIIVLELLL